MSHSRNVFSGGPGSEYQLPAWVNEAILNWRRNKARSRESSQVGFGSERIMQTSSTGGSPRVLFNGVHRVDLSKTVNRRPNWATRPSMGESIGRESSSGANLVNSNGNHQPSSNDANQINSSENHQPSSSDTNQVSSNGNHQPSSSGTNQIASSRAPLRQVNGHSVDRKVNKIPSRTTAWLNSSDHVLPLLNRREFDKVLSSTVNLINSRKRYNCFPRLIKGTRLGGYVKGTRSSSSDRTELNRNNNRLPSAWLNAIFLSGSVGRPSRPLPGYNPFFEVIPGHWSPERKRQNAAPFPLSPEDCGLSCTQDMAWLVSWNRGQHPLPQMANSPAYATDFYVYRPCEDPVHLPGVRPRDCLGVRPFALWNERPPYMAHRPPTALIPRAATYDPSCPSCWVFPELHGVQYLCAFHMYYFVGVRSQDDFEVVRKLRRNPTVARVDGFEAPSVEAMMKKIEKCRGLLVGSTPEPGTNFRTFRGEWPVRANVGYIGQERERANRVIQSRAAPEADDIFSSPGSIDMSNSFTRRLLRSIEV